MSYKPEEEKLTAFLYGELSAEEHAKVEVYLENNPSKKEELEELRSIQKIMGKLQDKEVVEPLFVFDDPTTVVVAKNYFNSFIKSTIGLAASISILIMVAYFTQLNIVSNENGWQIAFGKQDATNQKNEISEESIKNMMQESLIANNQHLLDKINTIESDLINQFEAANSKNNQLTNYKMDQSLVDQYVGQLRLENRNIILSLMELLEQNQKKYMDEVIGDFANYLDQQRRDDLEIIQENFTSLQYNRQSNEDINSD